MCRSFLLAIGLIFSTIYANFNVEIVGNKNVSSDFIRAVIGNAGDTDPLTALKATGYFTSVEVAQLANTVYIYVSEYPVVKNIDIVDESGNSIFSPKTLGRSTNKSNLIAASLPAASGFPLSPAIIQATVHVIKKYMNYNVVIPLVKQNEDKTIDLVFRVSGNSAVVRKVIISGNKGISDAMIRSHMANRSQGILSFLYVIASSVPGAPYNDKSILDDIAIIKALYYSRGYFDVEVESQTVLDNSNPKYSNANILFKIKEGKRYRVNKYEMYYSIRNPDYLVHLEQSRKTIKSCLGRNTDIYDGIALNKCIATAQRFLNKSIKENVEILLSHETARLDRNKNSIDIIITAFRKDDPFIYLIDNQTIPQNIPPLPIQLAAVIMNVYPGQRIGDFSVGKTYSYISSYASNPTYKATPVGNPKGKRQQAKIWYPMSSNTMVQLVNTQFSLSGSYSTNTGLQASLNAKLVNLFNTGSSADIVAKFSKEDVELGSSIFRPIVYGYMLGENTLFNLRFKRSNERLDEYQAINFRKGHLKRSYRFTMSDISTLSLGAELKLNKLNNDIIFRPGIAFDTGIQDLEMYGGISPKSGYLANSELSVNINNGASYTIGAKVLGAMELSRAYGISVFGFARSGLAGYLYKGQDRVNTDALVYFDSDDYGLGGSSRNSLIDKNGIKEVAKMYVNSTFGISTDVIQFGALGIAFGRLYAGHGIALKAYKYDRIGQVFGLGAGITFGTSFIGKVHFDYFGTFDDKGGVSFGFALGMGEGARGLNVPEIFV